MSKISIVIVTYNEAEKLEKCLSSLIDIGDEIIVVDLNSTDNINEITNKYKIQLSKHPHVEVVEKVRNFAISRAKYEWILILDPDEQLTSTLISKIKQLTEQNSYQAINIPRKNIFFGKWIRHSNFWPDFQIRLFRKSHVTWNETIHSYPSVNGNILNLPDKPEFAIQHFGYTTVEEFISRMNRYTSKENKAKNPFLEFFKRYIWHCGFLDGAHGLIVSYLMLIYYISSSIKLWEKKK